MPMKISSDPRSCSVCGELFVPTIRSSRCPACRNIATQEWLVHKDAETETPHQKHLRLLRETGRRY